MQLVGMNVYAIVLAAIVAFMFGWLWYGVLFSDAWLEACGKSREEVKGDTPSPTPFIISFIGLVVMAAVLRHLGADQVTLRGGIVTGVFMWLGFVITTMVVNNAFRGAKPSLTLIDGGHWLGVLILQGAVIGWFGI
jgi:hypothetical protein